MVLNPKSLCTIVLSQKLNLGGQGVWVLSSIENVEDTAFVLLTGCSAHGKDHSLAWED
jgi:hypothetical protein